MERLVLWHRWVPPPDAGAALDDPVSRWRATARRELLEVGGELIGEIGASAAFAFASPDPRRVIETVLTLVEEAERSDPRIDVAFGGSWGRVSGAGRHGRAGAAVDRAQLLAHRAGPGELVLDDGARELLAEDLLFARRVDSAGAVAGSAVDRRYPWRSVCAASLSFLGPVALHAGLKDLAAEVARRIQHDGVRTLVLRGPVGAGGQELLAHLESRFLPKPVLRFGAAPGGMVPLGSLRLAMLSEHGDPAGVRLAYPGTVGQTLAKVAEAKIVPRDELAQALRGLPGVADRRPWAVLKPLGLVDDATVAALLDARELGADFVVFGRGPADGQLPRTLGPDAVGVPLPPPTREGSAEIARRLLGAGTPEEVVRGVAELGGDSVLGIVEASRTLVAVGDLVREDDGFRWRLDPPSEPHAPSTEELLERRMGLLPADSRRLLEIVCVAPDGWPTEWIRDVAARDGMSLARFHRARTGLLREALVTDARTLRPISTPLRWAVRARLGSGVDEDLHRRVSQVADAVAPGSVEALFYQAEGGDVSRALPPLGEAEAVVREAGYERAAARMSAYAALVSGVEASMPETYRLSSSPPPPPHASLPPRGPTSAEPSPGASSAPSVRPSAPPRSPASAPASAPPPSPPPSSRPPAAGADEDIDLRSTGVVPPSTPPSDGVADLDLDLDELDLDDEGSLPPLPPLEGETTDVGPAPTQPSPATSSGPEPDGGPSAPPPGVEGPADTTPPDGVPVPAAADPDAFAESVAEALLDLELDAASDGPPTDRHPTVPALDAAPRGAEPSLRRSLARDIRVALRARDFDHLEDSVRRAQEAGAATQALFRIQALGDLVRGNPTEARRSLRKARTQRPEEGASQTRGLLAQALLELSVGDAHAGVRAGLAAVAQSRRTADARGETAARLVLAACFRALGRPDQAETLEQPT